MGVGGELRGPGRGGGGGGVVLGRKAGAGRGPVMGGGGDPTEGRRGACSGAVPADGVARLYTVEAGHWGVEATYD